MLENPMLKMLGQNPLPNLSAIKNAMAMVQSAGNPQMMLQQMIGFNPQIRQALNYVEQNGGNAKEAFYKLAKEKGVNADEIISQLK